VFGQCIDYGDYLRWTGSADTPGEANSVYISAGYAYVSDGYSGLQVIDIANPQSPSIGGNVDTPSWADAVFVSGGYAYPTLARDVFYGEFTGLWIIVYDVEGRLVAQVFHGIAPAGISEARWTGMTATEQLAAAEIYYMVMEYRGMKIARRVGKVALLR